MPCCNHSRTVRYVNSKLLAERSAREISVGVYTSVAHFKTRDVNSNSGIIIHVCIVTKLIMDK